MLFVWDEERGALLEGMELGKTNGVMAVDAQGLIYASRETAPTIVAFDAKGKSREAWGEDSGGDCTTCT